MAQTNFTPISLYYSATATNVPTAGNLVAGELAINTADGKLFYKDSAGVVQTIATKNATAGTYSSITTNQLTIGTTQLGAGDSSMLKNRIINGAMVIDQRNAGASVTPSNTYTLDRWTAYASQSSKYTVQQNAGSVTPPAGFTNYLGVTSSSAYSITSSDIFIVRQYIEGYNIADLGFGTANAKTLTLSFWVRSSLTGTFGGSFTNSAENRAYPFTYTISAANTWEQKSVTFAGDTSGTWLTTNGTGMEVIFGLGVGSTYSGTAGAWAGSAFYSATGATSVVGTNGATFYITGVQLEVGSSATGFEYENYTLLLAKCYRYCKSVGDGLAGVGNSANNWYFSYPFEIPMRASPTITITDTSIQLGNYVNADFTSSGTAVSSTRTSANGASGILTGWTGLTAFTSYSAYGNTNGYFMLLTAEL